jgi:DNA anti-recombination protein RmuC
MAQPVRPPEPPHRASRDRQGSGGSFDLSRSLREVESYVARLRAELQQAQLAARRRDPAPERQRTRLQQTGGTAEEIDELRRHNQQLEEQNQELRHRIEELTSDHEDRAATLEINDSLEQFKSFLGLKLKEDFADYTAISRESLNEVVRRHAHEILGRIFAILQAEGVRFDQENS